MAKRRELTKLLRKKLATSPAVALLGPRQCGKTTLARSLGGLYFDLEQEQERLRLDIEWERVASSRSLVILDEAQTWPEVFPRLRAAIDADRARKGRFLLLGSVSPDLMRQVSESLAGRLALCELTPFLLTELSKRSERGAWLKGGYPDGGVLGGAYFLWGPWRKSRMLDLTPSADAPDTGLGQPMREESEAITDEEIGRAHV